MNFLSHIASLIQISPELKTELDTIFTIKEFEKGETILTMGHKCTHMYFVEKGMLRGYYIDQGKEITNWFSQEGEFATCFYAFVSQTHAPETIVALEDTHAVQISYSALQNLYLKFPETERIGRIITELYYIKLEEKYLSVQFKTAKERYLNLIEKKPTVLQRAPLGQIASYLGISQETLSRMRADF